MDQNMMQMMMQNMMNQNPNMMQMMMQNMINQNPNMNQMMMQNMINQNMMNPNMYQMMMNQMMMNPNMMNQFMMMYNQMFGMMPNIDLSIDDPRGWNLTFEVQRDGKVYNIVIDENKKVKEAINKFKLKSNMNEQCKFIFNNKELFPELEICQSGLQDGSKISVISLKDLKGA